MHLAVRLLDFVSSIGSLWAYSLLFISAFAEGLPLIGIFSPGGAMTVVAGFLAKLGSLDLVFSIVLSTVAATLGDLVGYSIGKEYGFDFLKKYGKYFFMREESRIAKSRELIQTHPGKSIILGRFSYLSRSIVPFLAGASALSFSSFIFYDVLGSVFWAGTHVVGGFVFGRGFELISKYINYILIIATLLSLVFFYTYRLINKRHHVFKRYHVYALSLNILSIYIFAKAVEDVTDAESLFKVDRFVQGHIDRLWTPHLIELFKGVTLLGGFYVASFISLVAFLILLRQKKHWYNSTLFFASISSGLISQFVIKYITQLPRPPHPLVITDYYSFPSGHTTIITLLGILIPYCFWDHIKTRTAKFFTVLASTVVVFAVAFSRIYLNAHWTSDVLAGLAVGVFWVTFYIMFLRAIAITEGKLLAFLKKSIKRLFSSGEVSV